MGAVLGFVTALREAHLPPEVVLLLFLPALLYWESLTTLQLLSPDLAWWHTLHDRINEICVKWGRRQGGGPGWWSSRGRVPGVLRL